MVDQNNIEDYNGLMDALKGAINPPSKGEKRPWFIDRMFVRLDNLTERRGIKGSPETHSYASDDECLTAAQECMLESTAVPDDVRLAKFISITKQLRHTD